MKRILLINFSGPPRVFQTAVLIFAMADRLFAAPPDAETLLKNALTGPTVAYAGEVTITHWSTHGTRAEEARVFVGGPALYRYEFLTPTGQVERVVVGTGGTEYVLLPGSKKVLRETAPSLSEKSLAPERAYALILANYRLSAPEEDEVAGRPVWTVNLTPVADGKPNQRLWLDPQTGVVLAVRRYGPATADAAALRFLRFEPNAEFDSDFFEIEETPGSIVKDHRFHTPEPSLPPPSPDSLPFGFVFTGSRQFRSQGETVTQRTYSDGLTVVSIFETARPVRASRSLSGDDPATDRKLHPLRVHGPHRVLQRRRGSAYFTLIGEGSENLLDHFWAQLP